MPSTLDARTLRDTMSRYLEALSEHREEIDSLNVFPVPDGDTGTNMLLTARAVDEALRSLDGAGLAEVGEAISRAALMGARGNSGVILSQVLRGMCARLCAQESPGAVDLAEALALAAEEAMAAVANPVDGTMLSVLRDASHSARDALADGAAPEAVAEAALNGARDSLERTREQLPALAAAGVVDAGGKGVVLLLDALVSAIRDVPLTVRVGPLGPVGAGTGDRSAPTDERFGFEVMYLLETDDATIAPLRERLGVIGDSLVVVGGGGLYNVHVHTDDPGRAVEEGIEAGRPRGVRITSLDAQVEACVAGEARGVRVEGAEGSASVVAVAEGDGFADLLRSLGASVVRGGAGENPSVGELVRAIEEAPAAHVFLLPNHRNVLPAATAAAAESTKQVTVVPARSSPQALAAAAAFTAGRASDANEQAMRGAAEASRSGAVAIAERAADTSAGPVSPGDHIGVADAGDLDGRDVVAVGPSAREVLLALVQVLRQEHHELLTLFAGAAVGDEEAEADAVAIRAAHPDLEVEVQRGAQPLYAYVVGLE